MLLGCTLSLGLSLDHASGLLDLDLSDSNDRLMHCITCTPIPNIVFFTSSGWIRRWHRVGSRSTSLLLELTLEVIIIAQVVPLVKLVDDVSP